MKLSKDQIKKLGLSAIFVGALLYGYFSMMLGPLSAREARTRGAIAALTPKVTEAKKQIQKTSGLEAQAPPAQGVMDELKASIPEGAPVAWFPPRVAEFFKRHGIDKTLTRLTNEFPEKDLAGFRRLVWTIDLPRVEFIPLGIAVAGLENEEPLLQVTNVSVEASKEDPQYQHAVLTVATLVKQ
jgi:hypothetical protein